MSSLPLCASERVTVSELRSGEESRWDAFVNAAPGATFFHLTAWRRVVETSLGHRVHLFAAWRGERMTGVFPVAHVRSRLFGDCLVSLPLTVYGGACAADAESHQALLAAGAELGKRFGVKYLELRNREEMFPSDLPGRDLYVTFVQDLSPGPDELMKRLPRDTRYAIRKSIKAGLEWTEDVGSREFYDIYAQNVHHLGTPVFSSKLFANLRESFPKQCRTFGVRKGGRLIAGVLCFYFRDEVIPYYAGALPEYFRDAPNNFMYWSLMCQSYVEGFRSFDFGRSKRGTGSFLFKSAWSMEVKPLPYRYWLIKAAEVPEMSPLDGKFRTAVALWKRLPAGMARRLGPVVIRLVPSV